MAPIRAPTTEWGLRRPGDALACVWGSYGKHDERLEGRRAWRLNARGPTAPRMSTVSRKVWWPGWQTSWLPG